eukprot:234661-Chlamydomonas_euryale.AAC.1
MSQKLTARCTSCSTSAWSARACVRRTATMRTTTSCPSRCGMRVAPHLSPAARCCCPHLAANHDRGHERMPVPTGSQGRAVQGKVGQGRVG